MWFFYLHLKLWECAAWNYPSFISFIYSCYIDSCGKKSALKVHGWSFLRFKIKIWQEVSPETELYSDRKCSQGAWAKDFLLASNVRHLKCSLIREWINTRGISIQWNIIGPLRKGNSDTCFHVNKTLKTLCKVK